MPQPDTARRGRILRRAFLFVTLALAAATAQAQSRGDPAKGEAKAKICHACHGEAGRAPLPMTPWLNGQLEEVTVLQLVLIREGLREVPQMAGMLDKLTDPDFFDIGAYYARQAPPKASGTGDAKRRERGAGLAKSMGCNSCHMGDYSGQKQVPRIANQREDYLATTLKAYRDNKRTGPDTSMNNAMYKVSDADIEVLAHFLAHLSAP
jgi:cytochrome c553